MTPIAKEIKAHQSRDASCTAVACDGLRDRAAIRTASPLPSALLSSALNHESPSDSRFTIVSVGHRPSLLVLTF